MESIVKEYVEMESKALSEKLKIDRIGKGYTLADVINLIGIGEKQLISIENNHRNSRLISCIKLGLLYGYSFKRLKELYPDVNFEVSSFDEKSEIINQKICEYVSSYRIPHKDMEALGVSANQKRRIKNNKCIGVYTLLNYMYFIPDLDLTDIFN